MRDNNESYAGSSVKKTACTLRSFPSRLEHALLIEGDVTSEKFAVLYGSIATDLDTVVHWHLLSFITEMALVTPRLDSLVYCL